MADEPSPTKPKLITDTAKKGATNLFTDGAGKASTMRLMSLIALGASIWFGWIALTSKTPSETGVYITTAFLLAAFAPKALQKYIELHPGPGSKLLET